MTPDKIFISIERTYGASNGQVIAMATPHTERQSVNDVEYIRKDALLEWLQKEYETNKWFYEIHGGPDELHVGRCEAYKQVINKIESL